MKLDDIDEWTNKKDKHKKKDKKVLRGGAGRGHEKQIEEMNKKYNEVRAKEKLKELEKE